MTNNDINQISKLLDDKLTPIQKTLEQHGKTLAQHSRILKSLKKDQSTMLKMLDSKQMQQRSRLKQIEEHLNLRSSV